MKGPVCSHHHYQYDYLWYANFRICKSHDMHFDSSIYSGNSLLKVWVRKCYTLATGISKSGWVYLCLLLLSVHYLALDNNIYVILNFSQQHAHSFSLLFSCHNLRSYIIELIHKILMSHFIFIILIVSFGKFPTFTSVGLTNAPYLGAHSTVPPWTRNSSHHNAYIYIYMNAYSRCDFHEDRVKMGGFTKTVLLILSLLVVQCPNSFARPHEVHKCIHDQVRLVLYVFCKKRTACTIRFMCVLQYIKM